MAEFRRVGRGGIVPKKRSIFCGRLFVGGGIDIAGCESGIFLV